MKTFRSSFFRSASAAIAGLVIASFASAISNPYILHSSSGTIVTPGNPQSAFYKVDFESTGPVESGSAAGIIDFSLGSDTFGEFLELSWGLNPKPIIDGAGLKASTSGIFWDASDFAFFNASPIYDAIRLYQDGIYNNPRGGTPSLQGISHGTITGTVGTTTTTTNVPDSGSTLALLAVSLLGFVGLRKKFSK